MIESWIYWMVGSAFVALALTIFGVSTSLHLSEEQRKNRVRKFGAIGLAIFFFSALTYKPYVSSSSDAELTDRIKAVNVNAVEELAKLSPEQTQNIESLKKDIMNLREDVERMDSYYSAFVQFLSVLIGSSLIGFAFRKEKK